MIHQLPRRRSRPDRRNASPAHGSTCIDCRVRAAGESVSCRIRPISGIFGPMDLSLSLNTIQCPTRHYLPIFAAFLTFALSSWRVDVSTHAARAVLHPTQRRMTGSNRAPRAPLRQARETAGVPAGFMRSDARPLAVAQELEASRTPRRRSARALFCDAIDGFTQRPPDHEELLR